MVIREEEQDEEDSLDGDFDGIDDAVPVFKVSAFEMAANSPLMPVRNTIS